MWVTESGADTARRLLSAGGKSGGCSTETAELSADIALAKQEDRLCVFTRDPDDPARLVSQGLDEGEVLELIQGLAGPDIQSSGDMQSNAAPSGRIAKLRGTILRRLRRGSQRTQSQTSPTCQRPSRL